ncbi:MAG: hypothetical protein ACLU4J_24720 [Butyricimonas paravirosa]
MACCYSSLFNRLSGRMGRVIYYQVGNHLYARAAPGEVKIVVRSCNCITGRG